MRKLLYELPAMNYGANDTLAPGAMAKQPVEGAMFRQVRNMRPHDGVLRPREIVQSFGSAPPYLDDEDQSVILIAEIVPAGKSASGLPRYLVVTTREIFLKESSNWINRTPTYAADTVTLTNGSPTVTGSSTLWIDSWIVDGMPIELPRGSGDWYVIDTVDSNTQITLTENFTGTGGAGQDYSIRRVASLEGESKRLWHVHWCTINEDLYIAGPFAGGDDGSGNRVKDGGIYRILRAANPDANFAINIGPTELLVAGSEAEPGIDTLGSPVSFWGLEPLPDGRLVAAARVEGESWRRLVFCSPVDVFEWDTTPGGFVDIQGFNGPITALRRGSNALFAHMFDGIARASFAPDANKPLDIRSTRSTVGSLTPKTIQSVSSGPRMAAGDMFLAHDRRLYSFSGDVSTPSMESYRALIKDVGNEYLYWSYSRYDSYRREFCLAIPQTVRTMELRLSLGEDSVYEASYPGLLYATHQVVEEFDIDGRPNNIALYGSTRFDDDTIATNLIYKLQEDIVATDDIPDNTGGTPTVVVPQVLTDWFFPPEFAAMTVAEVVVWAQLLDGVNTSKSFDVDLIRDGTTVSLAHVSSDLIIGPDIWPRRYLVDTPRRGFSHQLKIANVSGDQISRIVRVQVFGSIIGSGRAEDTMDP